MTDKKTFDHIVKLSHLYGVLAEPHNEENEENDIVDFFLKGESTCRLQYDTKRRAAWLERHGHLEISTIFPETALALALSLARDPESVGPLIARISETSRLLREPKPIPQRDVQTYFNRRKLADVPDVRHTEFAKHD